MSVDRFRSGWVKGLLGLLALLILMAWSGGCFRRQQAPGTMDIQRGHPVPKGARTVTAKRAMWHPRIDVVGTAVSGERVNLSARISAYVKEVFVSAGDEVSRGQVLLTLDDRELREQLAVAQAGLQQAQTEYERTRKLVEANAATDQALTAVKSAYDAARAKVQQIEVMLTYTEIRSPLNGKVTDRRIEAGDLANPGQVLLAVYDPVNMRMDVPVPIRLVDKLAQGTQVPVTIDQPVLSMTGRVVEVVAEVDPASRTQTVKVQLRGDTSRVLPGMFGRVWVYEDPRPSIVIPAKAFFRLGQLEMVQVVEDGRWSRRLVRAGARQGDRLEILSGLGDGEQLLAPPVR